MWSIGINDGSGWAGDFFWSGGSGGVLVFRSRDRLELGLPGLSLFHMARLGDALFWMAARVFSDHVYRRRRRMDQRRAARTQHGRNHRPNDQPDRRPMGHGQQLDPRQLAIGLRRRLALRRLQSQRLAERHRHPRVKLGAEPLGVSSMRRPDRATDDQHSPVRQWCPAAQTRCGRCRRLAGRHRVDRVRRQRAGQSQPQRSGRRTRDGRHPVHHRNRERGTERGQRDRVLARRLALPVLFRLEHAAGRAGGRRAPRELLCA